MRRVRPLANKLLYTLRTDRRAGLPQRALRTRRGVASVLSMMFLVIFGSLAAAMAVVAQGNLRTADSALKVSRAMSAAETGLVLASRRLDEQSNRFVVDKGVIDSDFGSKLWLGTYSGDDGDVTILEHDSDGETLPSGILEGLYNVHEGDLHHVDVAGYSSDLSMDAVNGILIVPPIALTSLDDDPNPAGPVVRLKYELYTGYDFPVIRITSQGIDGDVTRTLQLDYQLRKQIEYAIISPSRIMIGKNVRVEGPLGTLYGIVAGELDPDNGDPLVKRSDFYYLNDDLDTVLDLYFAQLKQYDVDGDGRLRPSHPVEAEGLEGYDSELSDYDGNEFVDDMDLFMAEFDDNSDYRVVYDAGLAAAAGLGTLSEEFADIDDQLARLIDEAMPDRNGDGAINILDTRLGYQDGVLDINDVYAKVRGRLLFAVSEAAWETAHGDQYQSIVQGPIVPGLDEAPVTFEASEEDLREISTDMFGDSHTWFESQVPDDAPDDPVDFLAQVDAGIAAGGTFTAPSASTWEDVPYGAADIGGSGGHYDWYQRPVYQDMTFTNVRIPMGNNGLYENCTFVGVTYIETHEDIEGTVNGYNWNYAGAKKRVPNPDIAGAYFYLPVFATPPLEMPEVGGTPVDADEGTKPFSNNIRFHNCTFIGSVSGSVPNVYTHWRNKTQFTGTTQFFLDTEDEELAVHPDSADIVSAIESMGADDIEELEKSSILMPGWSIDVGNFSNEVEADPEDTPTVKLKGTIIAGIIDVRGTADVFGTLMMTFRPVAPGDVLPDEDAGPLAWGGQTDTFNTTIGYFGPSDGDGEGVDPDLATFDGFGEITLRYNPDAKLPDGIPWPVSTSAVEGSYHEGGEI